MGRKLEGKFTAARMIDAWQLCGGLTGISCNPTFAEFGEKGGYREEMRWRTAPSEPAWPAHRARQGAYEACSGEPPRGGNMRKKNKFVHLLQASQVEKDVSVYGSERNGRS